jgi:uncharacterized protein YecT (DUF1311 family)
MSLQKSRGKILLFASSSLHVFSMEQDQDRAMTRQGLSELIFTGVGTALLGASLSASAMFAENEFAAFCESFKSIELPAAARASNEDRALYPTRDSCPYLGYTYLIAQDSDELRDARRCWIATDTEPLTLGIAFANGWGGVKADYDAATHFLCRVDLDKEPIAPAELWGMTAYVYDMRKQDDPKPLTYCDHITSGRGGQVCEQIRASDEAEDQQRRFDAIELGYEGVPRRTLKDLQPVAFAFAEKDGEFRQYGSRGGTAHAGMQLEAEMATKEQFIAMLERLARARAPTTVAHAKDMDRGLNAAYKKILAAKPMQCTACSNPQEQIDVARDAQRAWVHYRDAWVAFYTARWERAAPPVVLRRECETALATERTVALLKHIEGED